MSHGRGRDRAARVLLACAALVSIAVGVALLILPQQLRATYGLHTPLDANALSEVRAPGGALIGLGALMACGCASRAFRSAGLGVATATFLGYALARLVSWALDGRPSSDLFGAAAVELLLGVSAALLWAWPDEGDRPFNHHQPERPGDLRAT